jgi:hypothetical protein
MIYKGDKMIKRKSMMGLMPLGLCMALLLVGCGSSSDSTTITTPTTQVEVAASLVGTWDTGCVDEAGLDIWYIQNLKINADNTGLSDYREYSAAGCNAADEILTELQPLNYTVGNETTAADGDPAVNLDIGFSGDVLYTMVRFINADLLYVADKNLINDGLTPATRANDFSTSPALIRQ